MNSTWDKKISIYFHLAINQVRSREIGLRKLSSSWMNLFVLCSFISIAISCSSVDEVNPDAVEFSEEAQEKYYKMNDKRNREFLSEIQNIESKHGSFIANFSLRIDRYSPYKEKFYADGKIFVSKETGMVKIQLMDNFFGMIFSEVIASPTKIQVKSSQDQKIHTQPMGDLSIYDPSKQKTIVIPFPVIYHSITGDYTAEFEKFPSFFSPYERRVSVKKGNDEYVYFFDRERLLSLEWIAGGKGMKAVAKTGDKPSFPPTNLVTKIIEMEKDLATVLIVTKLRSVQKKNPAPSNFQF